MTSSSTHLTVFLTKTNTKKLPSNEDQDDDFNDLSDSSESEDFDPMTWTPLQDVIDAMPTFEISS